MQNVTNSEIEAALLAEASRLNLAPLGLDLDVRARERFEAYLALLLEWNERAGLTTVTEPIEVVRRHFGESLALLAVLRRAELLPQGARVIDVGSGAGLPGLPMAIVDPTLQVTLLESHGRRARFLELAVEALALNNVRVVHARAEDAGRNPKLRETFDVAIARALAALAVLLELTLPLVRPGGLLATPKGERGTTELVEAAPTIEALGGRAEPSLELPVQGSVPAQTVLVVRRVAPLDTRFPRRAGVPAKRPLGQTTWARVVGSPSLPPNEEPSR